MYAGILLERKSLGRGKVSRSQRRNSEKSKLENRAIMLKKCHKNIRPTYIPVPGGSIEQEHKDAYKYAAWHVASV